jgi:hypothetical protein
MQHTKECLQEQEAAAQYMAEWPDHCPKCHGAGQYSYEDDPSPAGVSLSSGSYTYTEPCEECVECGVCPRCGKESLWAAEEDEPDNIYCTSCSWKWGDEGQSYHECYCYELSMNSWEAQQAEQDYFQRAQ